ncbi:MAG: hypothetical protein JOY85_03095 [Acidobacteriaceae bacterium]|nr:hypothetical protein [Acidobacteriaceae bacterium]
MSSSFTNLLSDLSQNKRQIVQPGSIADVLFQRLNQTLNVSALGAVTSTAVNAGVYPFGAEVTIHILSSAPDFRTMQSISGIRL